MAEPAAQAIVDAVGGPENIESLTHCATRLRFQLVNSELVNTAALDEINEVMGSVPQAGNRPTCTTLVSLFVSEVVEEFLCLGADFGGGGDLLAADLDGDVS